MDRDTQGNTFEVLWATKRAAKCAGVQICKQEKDFINLFLISSFLRYLLSVAEIVLLRHEVQSRGFDRCLSTRDDIGR